MIRIDTLRLAACASFVWAALLLACPGQSTSSGATDASDTASPTVTSSTTSTSTGSSSTFSTSTTAVSSEPTTELAGTTDGTTITASTSTDISSTSATTTGGPLHCDSVCPETTIHRGSVDVFPENFPQFECVSEIQGDLSFFDTGWVREQFAALRRVTGTLRLNTFGCDFQFLSCLESVGSLQIDYPLECLTDLQGLENLTTIEDLLKITDAPGLVSLAGLNETETGPMRLEIARAPLLTSIAGVTLGPHAESVRLVGLSKLESMPIFTELETVGIMTLTALPAVPSLVDLNTLTTASRLEFGRCPVANLGEGLDSVQSLAGLDSLTTVDVLVVAGNDGLTSLQGAPLLMQMNEVVLVDNTALSDSAISEFLAQNQNPNASTCAGDGNECMCP